MGGIPRERWRRLREFLYLGVNPSIGDSNESEI